MPCSLSDAGCGFCEAELEHSVPLCSSGEFTASQLSKWDMQRTYNEPRTILYSINILSKGVL